jgi:hypothetical protein
MIGLFQNQIKELPALNRYRYEKIFRVYKDKGVHYFYNILQALHLPDQVDETKVYYITVKQKEPWTMISFRAYRTIELWWLLCLINKIYNPLLFPASGTTLKVLRPQYLPELFNEIETQLV